MDASSIATMAIVVVGMVAVVALALGMLKRLRRPRLEVRLDEAAALKQPLPRHAGRYAARVRIFVSNVGKANARDTNVWLRFDTNHLTPLMKVSALPTTVEDFEVSRVDIRSVRLRSEAILKGGEPERLQKKPSRPAKAPGRAQSGLGGNPLGAGGTAWERHSSWRK